MRKVLLASTIALLGLTGTAKAHFVLSSPPAVVVGEPNGKGSPPCGPDKAMAAVPTAVQGGHPLKISVTETVGHLGFYRVALAIKSRSEFPVDNVVYDSKNTVLPPSGMPSGSSDHADIQNPVKFPVLADGLFDHEKSAPAGMTYSGDVMLPNVNCDRCVLQVIEFMHPHPFNFANDPPPGGGYFYHHCAELKITADPAMPLFVPPGTDGGVPDAAGSDAGKDSSTAGTAGTTGAAGNVGASGTSGGSGGGAGTTGTSGTGGNGSTGTAGASGSSGGAGTTGAAGTTGVAGSAGSGSGGTSSGKPGSSSGCAVGGAEKGSSVEALLLVLGIVLLPRARRRASR